MKASLLVFSQTGNTRKVGSSIAHGLTAFGIETEEVGFLQRGRWHPETADIIGIGCPVFSNRPAEVVPQFLSKGGHDLSGKKAFVFVTSGGSPAKSLWHLAQAVAQAGATVVGGVQLRGTSTFPTLFGLFPQRPHPVELGGAEAFGRAVAAHVLHGQAIPPEYRIDRKRGGIFYDAIGPLLNRGQKQSVPAPTVDLAKCDLCGNCVFECPPKNITVADKQIRFADECIYCYRCWHVCPQDAITARFSPGNGFFDRIIYSETMERWFGDVQPGEHAGENLWRDALARKVRLKYDRKNPTGEWTDTPEMDS